MDITTDGFGFMLAVGDLLWVPFIYSLQARYLVFKQVELGPVWVALTLITNFTGYYIFRDANGEKNDFRNGRNPKSMWNTRCFVPVLICTESRFEVLYYTEWVQAFNIRMVGSISAPQLFVRLLSIFHLTYPFIHSEFKWRPPHGFRVVSAYRLRHADHVLLRHVLCRSSCPQAISR
jgi:Ergosterol biosynthesis ERG4/ERG24 family